MKNERPKGGKVISFVPRQHRQPAKHDEPADPSPGTTKISLLNRAGVLFGSLIYSLLFLVLCLLKLSLGDSFLFSLRDAAILIPLSLLAGYMIAACTIRAGELDEAGAEELKTVAAECVNPVAILFWVLWAFYQVTISIPVSACSDIFSVFKRFGRKRPSNTVPFKQQP